MRSLGLSVAVCAGYASMLVGCAETGAHLTFSAPEGPGAVTSFRVVLATPQVIPNVGNQRVGPGELTTQSVSYYYQRTVAGGSSDKVDHVDGFAVRIEPSASMTETEFIPFVLMYEGEQIVGVGTFRASDSLLPSPILVVFDEIDKYVLDIEPTVQVADTDPVAAGQVRVVECSREDQSLFTSGVVWRPKGGGEFRLLFPDDDGLDATKRTLDLDCDGHVVSVESSGRDCDDSRGWFHRDAREMCDGHDTNCDGLHSMVVACTPSVGTNVCADAATNTGIALCNDRTGEPGACTSDPQCACAQDPTGCRRCLIPTETGSTTTTVKPCQPSVGYVNIGDVGCSEVSPCIVDVLGVGGGWKAEVAAESQTLTFGSRATVPSYKVVLRVKRPEGPVVEIAGTRGESTGDVTLGITTAAGQTYLTALDLTLEDAATVCTSTGPFPMVCN